MNPQGFPCSPERDKGKSTLQLQVFNKNMAAEEEIREEEEVKVWAAQLLRGRVEGRVGAGNQEGFSGACWHFWHLIDSLSRLHR